MLDAETFQPAISGCSGYRSAIDEATSKSLMQHNYHAASVFENIG
jgi:hypothetical protein